MSYWDAEERFWGFVNKNGPIHPVYGQCWVWTGYCGKRRKGVIYVEGEPVYASRFSYARFIGPISEGDYVLHHCDNEKCVRPDHLFTGDQQANMSDMVSKNRQNHPQGEANGRAILTEDDVRFIRANYCRRNPWLNQRGLAERFGVCVAQIGIVLRGEQWKHVK